ncbi:MAG: response regulator [Kiritimatiellae bacterium]|nr:response regulator [Kiritimatiellia bacterium]
MKKPVILIVDDEKNTREGLHRALRRSYDVLVTETGQQALDLLSDRYVDIVLSDVRMPVMDGITLMKRILARTPQPICILLTAYGNVDTAVEAMKQGAYDFLTKPVNLDRLDLLLKRALQTRDMASENKRLQEQLDVKFGLENIIGQSAAMGEVFDMVKQVATSKTTILIEGESGTGKELVANAIHQLSPRHQSPFVPVHCAALSETLLESELFGHERGSFTGATERRQGRFELADGGTLFLDEIGEVDSSVQVKMLRVLEERSFERVGGQKTIDVDVRIVTATNKNLKQLVDQQIFREDLFYRLHVVVIRIPPLRERVSDIPLLIQHFIKEFNKENNKHIEGVTTDTAEMLMAYTWPGNIRELRNAIERMVVLTRSDRLSVPDVPSTIKEGADYRVGPKNMPEMSLEEAEKDLIINALKKYNGNRTKAAEQLGISRRTLHRKLNEYSLKEEKTDTS